MTAVKYILGFEESEIARLDGQAAQIAESTRTLLRAAGIAPGMRVLDLGTGLGAVAFELADLLLFHLPDRVEVVRHELGIESLEARLVAAIAEADATVIPPALVGCWGSRRDDV
jgi:hypothetical protein